MTRRATLEHLALVHSLLAKAHHEAGAVDCPHRIVFHDSTQEAVRVISPTPRFIAALMAGGYVLRERVVDQCSETGLPIFEGTGEIMEPMSYDEAIAFVVWKDMPRGVNHFQIMTTDDLPRVDGSIDKARMFRAAWRLKEAA